LPPEARGHPGALEAIIRLHFPRAVVRPQTELGALSRRRVWYVYRDGHPGGGGDPVG
jgi:hypothetical protein